MIEKKTFALGMFAIFLMGLLGCHSVEKQAATQRMFMPFEARPITSSDNIIRRFQAPDPSIISDAENQDLPNSVTTDRYPVDFPTVLRLAGADNWNVKIAEQRVKQASAEYCSAKSAWLPSITLGMGYNKHEGEIQRTEGNVIPASRNSLFFGGGAGIANTPLNGGSGGPARMNVDFSFADAIFKPLAARRIVGSEQARQNRVFNDTMLEASLAYYELVLAQSGLAVAQTNLSEAQHVAKLTDAFVASGKGTLADTSRIMVIVNNRQQQLATADAEIRIASARLATVLQLDPTKLDPEKGLFALDAAPIPLTVIDPNLDLNTMIQQAQSLRCEVAEAAAATHAARADMMAEQWRPWLPNLYLGYSGGVFGGGPGGDVPKLDGRSDLDIALNWQIRNLGVGTRARQDATRSRVYQRNFEMKRIRDQVAEQVTTTFHRVQQYGINVELQRQNIEQAGQGLEKNLAAIKGLEGLPLEAISSLIQLANARTEYLVTVINYNQWQIRLLRAAGQSLSADAELGQIANCNSDGCDVCIPDCPACFQKPKRCQQCSTRTPIRTLVSRLLPSGPCDSDCSGCGGNAERGGCSQCDSTFDPFLNQPVLFQKTPKSPLDGFREVGSVIRIL